MDAEHGGLAHCRPDDVRLAHTVPLAQFGEEPFDTAIRLVGNLRK